MDKLRILFSKTGRSVYISHLDLMHTFQRAFSRAGVELKYSEGFNPHPIISIALPLSVGMSSRCEIMDFRLNGEFSLTQLPAQLTGALPEGIEVFRVWEAERKINELKWLEVNGVFSYDAPPDGDALKEFFSRDEIIINKKTKRGTADVDIVPGIREISVERAVEKKMRIRAVLSAQEPTINPDLLAEALRQLSPGLAPDFSSFERVEVFDSGMNIFR